MLNLVNELQKAYSGDAWHGSVRLSLLISANPAKVFTHPIPNAHSIAEIVLHLTAWTEEVSSRLSGHVSAEPAKGYWPIIQDATPRDWEKIIFDFKIANEELIRVCESFDDKRWNDSPKDKRIGALGTGVTNGELLNGLIQHHAYHSGQIALLSKF